MGQQKRGAIRVRFRFRVRLVGGSVAEGRERSSERTREAGRWRTGKLRLREFGMFFGDGML